MDETKQQKEDALEKDKATSPTLAPKVISIVHVSTNVSFLPFPN